MKTPTSKRLVRKEAVQRLISRYYIEQVHPLKKGSKPRRLTSRERRAFKIRDLAKRMQFIDEALKRRRAT